MHNYFFLFFQVSQRLYRACTAVKTRILWVSDFVLVWPNLKWITDILNNLGNQSNFTARARNSKTLMSMQTSKNIRSYSKIKIFSNRYYHYYPFHIASNQNPYPWKTPSTASESKSRGKSPSIQYSLLISPRENHTLECIPDSRVAHDASTFFFLKSVILPRRSAAGSRRRGQACDPLCSRK